MHRSSGQDENLTVTLDAKKVIVMKIKLSDSFTYGKLVRFVLPSIIMMIFTSIYSLVDGFFVSNFTGKTDFAALNIVFPLLMIVGGIGFMTGTGGSALVAKTLGEGEKEKANAYFSLVVYFTLAVGLGASALGVIFIRPLSKLLGATDNMMRGCVVYGTIMLCAMPAFMLQNTFQAFFVAAEKPRAGLIVTIIAGVTNIIGDAVLVGIFRFGLAGAAAASALGQIAGGVVPVIYFGRKNSSLLRLGRTSLFWKAIGKTVTNGSSELLGSISSSVVNMLYNARLMRIVGEDGVSAYGVMMYVGFVFAAIFIGYSMGSAPIISYNYGAKNQKELKSVFNKSMFMLSLSGVIMTALAVGLADAFSGIFTGYDQTLRDTTRHGLRLYALHFLVCGINIYGSSFFTALNNGVISAILSFMRALVFQTSAVILLPLVIKPAIDGVWISVAVAEAAAFVLTVSLIVANGKKYGYAGKFPA